MKKMGRTSILKRFPTSSASRVSSSSDERVMTEIDVELRESEDNSMVEACDDARDSSSGSPKRFWMLNGCMLEYSYYNVFKAKDINICQR